MISLIVPYWNSEKWIGRCIQSLKSFDSADIEFIIVNDGSTDNGPDVVKQIAGTDERFVLVDNQRGKGVSGARNTGLDLAKGEWVTFSDADDVPLQNAPEVYKYMISIKDNANIIQANHLRYYEKKGKTVANAKYINDSGVYSFNNMPRYWASVNNKLYRRSFIEDNHIRFIEGFQYGEDEIFNLECISRDSRIYHTNKTTYLFVHHFENKQSLSHIKGKQELIRQTNELMNFLLRTNNKAAKIYVCSLISYHWSAGKYTSIFGD